MAKQPPVYRKLSGMSAHGRGRSRQLWLAEDHLLLAVSAYGFEKYSRFYFRDVQAYVVRVTSARLWWNLFFGVCGGVLLWPALLFFREAQGGIGTTSAVLAGVFAGAAFFFFLGIAINGLRGATCSVHLQTAAGLERLGAPGRWPAALRLAALLQPRILQAQGEPLAQHPSGTAA